VAASAIPERAVSVEPRPGGLMAACFTAMASPCEVLVDGGDAQETLRIGQIAAHEAWRVETRFSRYRADSIVSAINRGAGQPIRVDAETAALLDFAQRCYLDSEGAFDITCGILRRAWRFDGSDRVPAAAAIAPLLAAIGFDKLTWDAPWLTLRVGMELDFGGIGKEYAVDRALALASDGISGALLVNFGGDLACRGVPRSGAWQVGIEAPGQLSNAKLLLDLGSGALATSGDTHRYLMHEGRRLGHILDPRTGWPVEGGPASVTVAAASCIEAGTLATLALLQGAGAVAFLEQQGVRYWSQ
jgi:thiamine biosynthesis lipoprotein